MFSKTRVSPETFRALAATHLNLPAMNIYYFWHEEDGCRRFFTSKRRAKRARRRQEEEAGYYVGPLEVRHARTLLRDIERRNQDLEHAVLALSRLIRSLGEKLPSYLEETIRSVETISTITTPTPSTTKTATPRPPTAISCTEALSGRVSRETFHFSQPRRQDYGIDYGTQLSNRQK